MPDWCEGSLKVRGSYENLKRFCLKKNDKITFEDYTWECVMPNLGG